MVCLVISFFLQSSHSQYFSLVQDVAQKAHEVAGDDNNRHPPRPCHPFRRCGKVCHRLQPMDLL